MAELAAARTSLVTYPQVISSYQDQVAGLRADISKWQDTALKLGFDGLDAAIAWGEDRGRGRDQMPGDDYNRMPPSPDMVVVYYERLLRKYIDHIRQAEGNDLIDRIGEKFFSNVEFTDEEKATLMRLAGKGATDAAAE